MLRGHYEDDKCGGVNFVPYIESEDEAYDKWRDELTDQEYQQHKERKMGLTITESTTREELIERINDLEEEVAVLETRNEDLSQQVEDLSLSYDQKDRLEEAADLMADLGKIHNTPYAKRRWADGH